MSPRRREIDFARLLQEDIPCRPSPVWYPPVTPPEAARNRRVLLEEVLAFERPRGPRPACSPEPVAPEQDPAELCALCGHLISVHRFDAGLADDAPCPACRRGLCRVPRNLAAAERDAA